MPVCLYMCVSACMSLHVYVHLQVCVTACLTLHVCVSACLSISGYARSISPVALLGPPQLSLLKFHLGGCFAQGAERVGGFLKPSSDPSFPEVTSRDPLTTLS